MYFINKDVYVTGSIVLWSNRYCKFCPSIAGVVSVIVGNNMGGNMANHMPT